MAKPKTKCAECGKDSKGYVYCKECEAARTTTIKAPSVHFKGNGWAGHNNGAQKDKQ